ncbi:casein kinase I-like [Condylostylus longicornis]|uniref:casein kinase I-like n=1 Tax=Condylostylus longicornis TaxID=2530218 RepID=UPI00244E324F|nr:casein kinase I-like [Condylostylus longicornis]
MELLGPTLEEVFTRWADRQLDVATVALVGIEMVSGLHAAVDVSVVQVDRLEALHREGFVHRDVKPENFLIANKAHCKVVCIDFGLAKRFLDPQTKAHLPYNDRRSLTGTARYASVNAHMGVEPSRRDDLISAGHCEDLGFDQAPDYNYLRSLLSSVVADKKTLPV